MFRLRFNNPYGEVFYLVRLGDIWPHEPSKRLIDATCKRASGAKEFITEEDARACIVIANSPRGWTVEEVRNEPR